MSVPTAKVIHYTDAPAEIYGAEAPGVSIRQLITEEEDGAPVYVMRMIEVAPGGHTPRHSHPFEHENFIVEGKGRVLLGDEWRDVGPGDVALVPGGLEHTYENAGDTTFKFLCSIPVTRLMPT